MLVSMYSMLRFPAMVGTGTPTLPLGDEAEPVATVVVTDDQLAYSRRACRSTSPVEPEKTVRANFLEGGARIIRYRSEHLAGGPLVSTCDLQLAGVDSIALQMQ